MIGILIMTHGLACFLGFLGMAMLASKVKAELVKKYEDILEERNDGFKHDRRDSKERS